MFATVYFAAALPGMCTHMRAMSRSSSTKSTMCPNKGSQCLARDVTCTCCPQMCTTSSPDCPYFCSTTTTATCMVCGTPSLCSDSADLFKPPAGASARHVVQFLPACIHQLFCIRLQASSGPRHTVNLRSIRMVSSACCLCLSPPGSNGFQGPPDYRLHVLSSCDCARVLIKSVRLR